MILIFRRIKDVPISEPFVALAEENTEFKSVIPFPATTGATDVSSRLMSFADVTVELLVFVEARLATGVCAGGTRAFVCANGRFGDVCKRLVACDVIWLVTDVWLYGGGAPRDVKPKMSFFRKKTPVHLL